MGFIVLPRFSRINETVCNRFIQLRDVADKPRILQIAICGLCKQIVWE